MPRLRSPLVTHERVSASGWDGVTVGGSTAAAILGIGDSCPSPYCLYAPRRIRSRDSSVRFATRTVSREDVSFAEGMPVTRLERTLVDLAHGASTRRGLRGSWVTQTPVAHRELGRSCLERTWREV